MITSAVFPARYVQGRDALHELPALAAPLGDTALVVLDPGIGEWMRPHIENICQGKLTLQFFDFEGESTEHAMRAASEQLQAGGHHLVIGLGGGKAIDTAKGAAHYAPGTRIIAIPTIAASDAPCSKNAVIYNEDHSVARDLHGRNNPDMVIIDTRIVANAPSRFLSAGIADALATWFEAESAWATRHRNFTGYAPTHTAYVIANACYETLTEYAPLALSHCEAKLVTPALERVVEAATLMSTIGFESGGLGAAHGFHQGIAEWHETHGLLHGEKVAFGILASLFLTDKGSDLIERTYQLCHAVNLPLTLADLGVEDISDSYLMVAVERMMRPGECTFNEPVQYENKDYLDALKAADAYGRAFKTLPTAAQ
ncbi:glycerol dehydrogenase [Halomonas eurihalina]|uniref:Glycerol dehydrogenase n=1 Tax=Halomonas eurihalina TaxID=42566 RepID=A0A5D9DE00_HALER|nr:glycerol dehydrogenase [Halomonas eurihalina]MDR5858155.1 glycerol dehydrogenase [Halomonas eurihalina]TZG41340.1 glycerol dehydrogenase [Halomonas eurihalina]